jgi:hypothetical protein
MNLIDMKSRWVYKGSLTTPPCTRFVLFNVCKNIYPISEKHLNLFKNYLKRGEKDLEKYGNYRNV